MASEKDALYCEARQLLQEIASHVCERPEKETEREKEKPQGGPRTSDLLKKIALLEKANDDLKKKLFEEQAAREQSSWTAMAGTFAASDDDKAKWIELCSRLQRQSSNAKRVQVLATADVQCYLTDAHKLQMLRRCREVTLVIEDIGEEKKPAQQMRSVTPIEARRRFPSPAVRKGVVTTREGTRAATPNPRTTTTSIPPSRSMTPAKPRTVASPKPLPQKAVTKPAPTKQPSPTQTTATKSQNRLAVPTSTVSGLKILAKAPTLHHLYQAPKTLNAAETKVTGPAQTRQGTPSRTDATKKVAPFSAKRRENSESAPGKPKAPQRSIVSAVLAPFKAHPAGAPETPKPATSTPAS